MTEVSPVLSAGIMMSTMLVSGECCKQVVRHDDIVRVLAFLLVHRLQLS